MYRPVWPHQLAICVNYSDLNNSMLRMRGHVSAGFFWLHDSPSISSLYTVIFKGWFCK